MIPTWVPLLVSVVTGLALPAMLFFSDLRGLPKAVKELIEQVKDLVEELHEQDKRVARLETIAEITGSHPMPPPRGGGG